MTRTMVSTGVIRVTTLVLASHIVTVFARKGMTGYERARPPVKYSAQFCSRYDTPMAEIMTDIRGEDLSGLYATRSITTPSTTVSAMTRIIDTHIGRPPAMA